MLSRSRLTPDAPRYGQSKDRDSLWRDDRKEQQHHSLYERAVERMNHKALFNKIIENKRQRDAAGNPGGSASKQKANSFINQADRERMERNDRGERGSAKKSQTPYLLNDSFERGTRKKTNEVAYNNFLGNDGHRVGTLIRKAKNEPELGGHAGPHSSKLKNTILKRVLTEESEFEELHGYKSRYNHPGQSYYEPTKKEREVSLEMYKKQLAKQPHKRKDGESGPKDNLLLKDHSRHPSRSRSRQGSTRPVDISNDRIHVGKLLDFYRDQYD